MNARGLTPTEAAKVAGISPRSMYRLILARPELVRATRTPGGRIMIPVSAAETLRDSFRFPRRRSGRAKGLVARPSVGAPSLVQRALKEVTR